MKLIAGSLDVEVGAFLHAGYISAYPRSFEIQGGFRVGGETQVIDIKKALELKDSPDPSGPTESVAVSGRVHSLPPASVISEGFTLAIVFLFFAWLLSFYYRRVRKMERPAWRPWVLAGAPLLPIVLASYWAVPVYQVQRLNNLPPPWEGVPVRKYVNPEAATHAILQTLVVNGLAGAPFGIASLAAIQNEVAFPVAPEEYTPGMTYAEKAYGRDGWGREFSFELLETRKYRIASAGPDGAFGTDDDILVVADLRGDWEDHVSGIYVRPTAGNYMCFVHRVQDSMYVARHVEEAYELIGNSLFDMFPIDLMARFRREPLPVLAQLKEHQERRPAEEKTPPLYFVQFMGKHNG